jgi:hypothetical protein
LNSGSQPFKVLFSILMITSVKEQIIGVTPEGKCVATPNLRSIGVYQWFSLGVGTLKTKIYAEKISQKYITEPEYGITVSGSTLPAHSNLRERVGFTCYLGIRDAWSVIFVNNFCFY